jgi:LPXTG-motif cell wall-anchored protein
LQGTGSVATLPATGAQHLDVQAGVAVDALFVGGLLLVFGRRRRRA